jgi:hypothetical protein
VTYDDETWILTEADPVEQLRAALKAAEELRELGADWAAEGLGIGVPTPEQWVRVARLSLLTARVRDQVQTLEEVPSGQDLDDMAARAKAPAHLRLLRGGETN